MLTFKKARNAFIPFNFKFLSKITDEEIIEVVDQYYSITKISNTKPFSVLDTEHVVSKLKNSEIIPTPTKVNERRKNGETLAFTLFMVNVMFPFTFILVNALAGFIIAPFLLFIIPIVAMICLNVIISHHVKTNELEVFNKRVQDLIRTKSIKYREALNLWITKRYGLEPLTDEQMFYLNKTGTFKDNKGNYYAQDFVDITSFKLKGANVEEKNTYITAYNLENETNIEKAKELPLINEAKEAEHVVYIKNEQLVA